METELLSLKSRFTAYKDDCKDIANIMFISIWKTFNSSDMWGETVEIDEKNNSRILSYVYSVLTSSTNEFFKDTPYSEDIKLWIVVNKLLKKLSEENKISVQAIRCETFYHKCNTENPISISDQNLNYKGSINVWKGKGSKAIYLNHQLIKQEIIKIINSLEKYKFTVSDICKVIKTHSNFDKPARVLPVVSDNKVRKNSGTEELDLFIDTNDGPDVIQDDFSKANARFLVNLERLYPATKSGKKNFTEDIKILFWSYNEQNLNQEQIALRVFNNKNRFRTISTRQKRIRKKLLDLKKKFLINQDEKEMTAILSLIKKQFIDKKKQQIV